LPQADKLAEVAAAKGVTAAQLAIAWVLAKGKVLGNALAAIPGRYKGGALLDY
jgi:aryl-alcohol dehydrogenase-like predicted oxidoreductase